ncbi:MAG TPA: alpha/beta hydrolase [Acidimicrobiales bacterium]
MRRGEPVRSAETIVAARELRLARILERPLSDRVIRADVTVPGSNGAPDLVLRTHTPRDPSGPLPCIYSMHGGGYVLGHRAMDDATFDQWCPEFGVVGVSVEYRLAPEAPYPAALDDCFAGLRWVVDNADQLGIDPTRVGLSGGSAGGGLAAAVALLARDRDELRPAFQLLAYPMLDDRQTTTSSHWDVPPTSPADVAFGWHCYLGALRDAGTDIPAYAAPARAVDLAGLAPTLVYVGAADVFCDEAVLFAMKLYQSGVPTELHVVPGAPHGFDVLVPDAPASIRCRNTVRDWLGAVLA